MKKDNNLLVEEMNKVNESIAWLAQDLNKVTNLINFVIDAESLDENSAVHDVMVMIKERISDINEKDIMAVNTGLEKSIKLLLADDTGEKKTRTRRPRSTNKEKEVDQKKVDNKKDMSKKHEVSKTDDVKDDKKTVDEKVVAIATA